MHVLWTILIFVYQTLSLLVLLSSYVCMYYVPPIYIVAPYNVIIMGDNLYSQGDQLQLNCSSEGGPQLEYTWTFSGSIITNTNSNILTIDNITTSNGGNYTCNVTNNAGSDNNTITVYGKSLSVIVIGYSILFGL